MRTPAQVGFIIGLTFSLFTVLASGLSPVFTNRGGNRFASGVLIVTYLCIGTLSGAVVGVCRSLMRYRPVAALTGVLTIAGIGVGFHYAEMPRRPWDRESTCVLLVAAVAIGVPSGLIYRRIFDAHAV